MMEKLSQVYSLLVRKNNNTIFCSASWRYLSRFICFFSILGVSSVAHAAELYQKCVDATVCTGPYGKDCTTRTYCTWVLGDPPVYTPPPSSPPTPTPNAGGVGSSSPVKSVAEIEREAHVKFCKEFPVKISNAVDQCKNNAEGYYGYFVGTKCSGTQLATWNLKVVLKDMIDVGYSQEITPGPTCVTNAVNARDFTKSSCDVSGNAYRAALASQCSDVP